jgi:hypothetical protein
MKSKTLFIFSVLLLLSAIPFPLFAQNRTFDQLDERDNMMQGDEENRNFNPHNNDSTKKDKVVPKGIFVWTVDRHFGDIRKTEVDTLPHLFPQSTMAPGMYGQYNTIGSNFTARQSRIFTDRRPDSQFLFIDTYNQMLKQPEEWHFTNTLSPITNLNYGSCGDKNNGEDLLDAQFAVNAGKKTGIGFDLDYRYARGYFQNQSNSHFAASFYASHLGDRYQMHLLFQTVHQKASENGGVTNDNYITHPELYTESYTESEIPTVLGSNWNRNNHQRLFLTHRYSVGFYRKVPMTEEEIKAKKFAEEAEKEKEALNKKNSAPVLQGRPDDARIVDDTPKREPQRTQQTDSLRTDSLQADSLKADSLQADSLRTDVLLADSLRTDVLPADSLQTDSLRAQQAAQAGRIRVDSKEMADSLIRVALQEQADTADQYMKREFVPVTSFIHTAEVTHYDRIYQAYYTPENYYANTFFDLKPNGGYTGDSIYDKTQMLNVRNTVAIALLEGFNKYAAAGLKAFASHDLRRFDMPELQNDTAYMNRWSEHSVSVGGQLTKTEGSLLHYDLLGELWVAGEDAGQLKLDARGDLNFPLLGDTVRLDVHASLHRLNPVFLQRRYHSKHLWWDNDFSKETRTRLEGRLTIGKTNTSLRVALDEIENYTYLGMSYALDDEQRTGLSAAFRQHDASLAVFTAQLDQQLQLGPLHWDNIITFQTSSHQDVLPLPKLNVFTNLYLKFMVARVLTVEMGASGTWFTKYYVPDFLPQLNQFAVQQNPDTRMEMGNFPFVDVYANLHLKHTRFFVMMTNVTGTSFNRMSFLTPHYPLNRSVLHFGVSWNFFN